MSSQYEAEYSAAYDAVTRADIRGLRDEAGAFGDYAEWAICEMALGSAALHLEDEDLPPHLRDALLACECEMDQAAAEDYCRDRIAEVRAQRLLSR